jgi:glutamate-1-semialdehyde 2,1-aminomutase/spore coat polysaccharide biosynthesis protein SpsF
MSQRRSLANSESLRERASRIIPGCSQTFSKGPTQFVQGVSPVFLQRGKGSHVWDVDGNEYIDYINGLLPVILGYDYEPVTEAVIKQLRDGVSFSLPHPLEVELAERLAEIIPCAEMVRFAKNGSDATAGAVRAARAITGRDIIACCGYHGWQDWYIGTTTRNKGVPKAVQGLTVTFEYNNLESLKRIFTQYPGQVAAVIMEPVTFVPPMQGFLDAVQDLTRRSGALLIFDEICTGFRMALGGAQEFFNVVPDLACFGKSMGNGFPIAAVVGRREYMRVFDEVFFSFTFGGEAVSLAASLAVIRVMRENNVIGFLWSQGQKLLDGVNALIHEFHLESAMQCVGYPCWSSMRFRDVGGNDSLELHSLFQQEATRRGILTSGNHNISYSHSDEDIAYTLDVYGKVFEIMAEAMRRGDISARLEGDPIRPVFSVRR